MRKLQSLKTTTAFFIATLLFYSCDTIDVFEQTKSINKQEWESSKTLSFTFFLGDSTAFYNIDIVLRHTDAYHYNNIWLTITTKNPGDSIAQSQRVNLPLAANAKGWLGAGFDDIIEQRVLLNTLPVRLKPGNYTFTIEHIMREDPLKYVVNAGIRIEKVVQ
ncbi:MAG: gliding motility lipoprotein GldH [Parafilimonas sp.]